MVYRANEMNVRNNAFQDGYVVKLDWETGDDIADLLLGSMGVFAAHDQTFLGATTGRRWKLVRPFVQDDWRVTKQSDGESRLCLGSGNSRNRSQNRQANFDVQTLKWYVPKQAARRSADARTA
jgi:hypothetical protein